jgi:hypothetical protein
LAEEEQQGHSPAAAMGQPQEAQKEVKAASEDGKVDIASILGAPTDVTP